MDCYGGLPFSSKSLVSKNVISGSEPLDDISIMERVLLRETFILCYFLVVKWWASHLSLGSSFHNYKQ